MKDIEIQTKIIDLAGIEKLRQESRLSCDNIVFWVGSGIDSIAPTNLPRAAELLGSIMTKACGDSAEKILSLWSTAKAEIDRLDISQNEFSPLPRLETIVEQLMLCESHMKQHHSILPVIQCFQDAPPNRNHYALANAVRKGAHVVTTNYTLCIQSAFRAVMGGRFGFSFNDMYNIANSSTYVFESNYPSAGKIYHIHGIANDMAQLGASLNEVKKSLPQKFIEQLESWLSEGKIFIFCGYSGSDSFDVNRYFLGRESEQFNSTGVFVRHIRKDCVPPVPSHAREKEQILLQIFQKRYILAADTSDFLSLFGGPPKNLQYDKEPEFDWKIRSKGIYYPAIYHKNFCIQLCSFLGIDASLILGKSWIPSPEEQEVYSPWYTSHPCFTMARLRDDHEQIRFWGNKLKLVENENTDNIDNLIDESLQSFDDYSYAKIETIAEDTCSRRSGVGWECSTYINQCTNYLINKVLLCKTAEELKEVKCQYYKGAETLIKACISIIDGGYDKIVEMNQLHVALRDAAMLISVFTSDFEKAYSFLQQSTYYYVEISSIDGILGNLNSTQLIDFFHYLCNRDTAYRSDDLYAKITRLCNIVGFKRHENVAKRMKGFIDLMLMISSSGVTATS